MMLLVIRGLPRTGKTTLVKNLAEAAGSCEGFYTEEVLRNGNRVGFDVVTIDGKRFPLARIGGAGPRVGKYAVLLERFDRFCRELALKLNDSPGLLIIDEVGKMELMSEAFKQLLDKIARFRRKTVVLTAGKAINHPLIQQADRVYELTKDNREAVLAELLSLTSE